MHDDESYLRGTLEAGGAGFVLKRAADTALLSAIRVVSRGGAYLHPEHARGLLQGQHREPKLAPEDSYESLSPREREALRLIALGHTNREIADMLSINLKTVLGHRTKIMQKLYIQNSTELIKYAIRRGLVSIES